MIYSIQINLIIYIYTHYIKNHMVIMVYNMVYNGYNMILIKLEGLIN